MYISAQNAGVWWFHTVVCDTRICKPHAAGETVLKQYLLEERVEWGSGNELWATTNLNLTLNLNFNVILATKFITITALCKRKLWDRKNLAMYTKEVSSFSSFPFASLSSISYKHQHQHPPTRTTHQPQSHPPPYPATPPAPPRYQATCHQHPRP
jgi:hypothetical protein